MRHLLFFTLSFCIVAWGQPSGFWVFGVFAACLGYGVFWKQLFSISCRKTQFFIAWTWFFLVQAVQLSWMCSSQYMGVFIWGVYAGVICSLGLQFAVFSWMLTKDLTVLRCAAFAGVWTFFEWIRLFVCTGFTWNPVGLSLSCNVLSLQSASLFGVYGLSFWVVFINLLFLISDKKSFSNRLKPLVLWGTCSLFPFAYGTFWKGNRDASSQMLSVCLIQTELAPEQKEPISGQIDSFIPPLAQWARIFKSLAALKGVEHPDLIVFPEAALPFGAYRPLYFLEDVERIWSTYYSKESLPAKKTNLFWRANNLFLVQALANHYDSEVVIGLDMAEGKKQYNSAFVVSPYSDQVEKYKKRILVPGGEYIPLKKWRWLSILLETHFQIFDSFHCGKDSIVFNKGKVPFAVSICIEEMYGNFIREYRKRGAKLLVNLTNDVWFPKSSLAQQHFDHGLIRSVENGIPLVRSCNAGITGGVDCFGQALPVETQSAGAIFIKVPLQTLRTPYSFWGDAGILGCSLLFGVGAILQTLRKKEENFLLEKKEVD